MQATTPPAIRSTPAGDQLTGRGKKPRMPSTGSSAASIFSDLRQRAAMRIAARPSATARASCRKTSNSPVLREKKTARSAACTASPATPPAIPSANDVTRMQTPSVV